MNLAISNYPNQFLFKFDLPKAVIISIIIHLLLFFGDQLLKREMPKPTQDNFKFEAILLEQKVDQLGHFYTTFCYLGKLLFIDEDWNASRYRAIESLPSCIIKNGIFRYCITPFRF